MLKRSASRWLWIGILGLVSACGPQAPPTPHIFVYLIDTLRADHVGCYGYDRPTTPQIDAFAADAVRFDRAYTSSPWTRPAVASLFTGAPPAIHGVRGRNGWAEPELRTWAERLRDRGYRTIGRFANGNLEDRYGLGQGFDDYVFEREKGRAYVSSLELHARWVKSLPGTNEESEGPQFLYLHTMDPHIPFRAPRRYMRPFVRLEVPWQRWFRGDPKVGESIRIDINRYDGEIRQNDDAFGRFIDELVRRGWYENSWVVLVADHGEEFREHGFRGHGNGLWENLLRVPLIIHPPGGRDGEMGRRLAQLAEEPLPVHALADLIGGLEWPDWQPLGLENARWTGLSPETLAHWIPTPDRPAPPIRRASFLLDGRAAMMIAQGDRKLIWQEFPEAKWISIDLSRDPMELSPLASPDPELVAEMKVWYQSVRRGLELRNAGSDTLSLRLRPEGAFRGAHLQPGDRVTSARQERAEGQTTLVWRAPPGGRLLLERDVDQAWLLQIGEDPWIEVDQESGTKVKGLEIQVLGSARRTDALPPPMSEDLRAQLEALGYLD